MRKTRAKQFRDKTYMKKEFGIKPLAKRAIPNMLKYPYRRDKKTNIEIEILLCYFEQVIKPILYYQAEQLESVGLDFLPSWWIENIFNDTLIITTKHYKDFIEDLVEEIYSQENKLKGELT